MAGKDRGCGNRGGVPAAEPVGRRRNVAGTGKVRIVDGWIGGLALIVTCSCVNS
jgi:hypothetical protein